MAILVIDPTPSESLSLQLFHKQKRFTKRVPGRAESLLPALDRWLTSRSVTRASLTGLAVRIGGNRFSLQRQAVVIANTLGYALNIPVATMPFSESSSHITLADVERSLKNKRGYTPVRATYSQPPSISKPRPTRYH